MPESLEMARVQFINWQLEYEAILMSNARGEDTPETDVRLGELDKLLDASPFHIDMDADAISSWEDKVVLKPND